MDDGIVIGEGVLLDARPTSVASRLGAALIDLVALGLVLLGLVLLAVNVVTIAPSDDLLRITVVVAMVIITVVLPEFVLTRWWEQLLHNQTALLLKGRLLFRRNTVVVSVPYHIERGEADVTDLITVDTDL